MNRYTVQTETGEFTDIFAESENEARERVNFYTFGRSKIISIQKVATV